MLYGYDSFRDASVRILESRVNVIIFRNLLSRCLHCAQLYRGRSLFSPPFLASSPSFFSSDLLSLIEPSSRRVDQRQDFFFFPPVYTTSCTRSRLFANTYEPRDSAFRLLSPCSPSSRRARAFVDTRRHAKRANPRTPGAAYFNQLAYVHCLLGVPDSLRYTSRNNDRTQQHSAAPSLFFVREQSIRDNNVALRSRDCANRVLFSLRLCPPPRWVSRRVSLADRCEASFAGYPVSVYAETFRCWERERGCCSFSSFDRSFGRVRRVKRGIERGDASRTLNKNKRGCGGSVIKNDNLDLGLTGLH